MFLFVISSNAQDKDIKRPDSYNYSRDVEAIQQENYKEALEYLNKEIEENPKNGYAYAWIAAIRENYQEYGRAITDLDLALKYLPKKDKTYRTWVYTSKADVYKELDEYDKTYECMSLAIATDPTEVRSYDKRAQLLFEQEKYAQADADYQKMIELTPGISVLPKNEMSHFGHIAIYDGKQWVSDFKQKSVYPGIAYRSVGSYRIYRATNGWHWKHVWTSPADWYSWIESLVKGYKKIKLLCQ